MLIHNVYNVDTLHNDLYSIDTSLYIFIYYRYSRYTPYKYLYNIIYYISTIKIIEEKIFFYF